MKFGVIGEHLKHSFSKEIHEKIADYSYVVKEIEPDKVEGFMLERDFLGINVTIPYKEKVIPMLDYVDTAAMKIGAVNTVVNKGGKLIVHRYLTHKIISELIRDTVDMAFSVNVYYLSAIGTNNVAHIFYQSEHRYVHKLCHISRFLYYHRNKLLGA